MATYAEQLALRDKARMNRAGMTEYEKQINQRALDQQKSINAPKTPANQPSPDGLPPVNVPPAPVNPVATDATLPDLGNAGKITAPGVATTDALAGSETKPPETIGDVVAGMTYKEKADLQEKGSYLEYADTYKSIMGTEAPFKTREEYLAWRKNQNQEDLDYLDQQQEYSRDIEKMQFQQAKEQATGAVAATNAQMAQGREGAMSGTASQFTSEFQNQITRNFDQLNIQRASAESQRQKAMTDLKRAQESGDMDMVQAIQGRISSIEDELRQNDSQQLQIATIANEQTLNERKFEHSVAMDAQAEYRANFGMFGSMVDSGAVMSTDQISKIAASLNVPFEVANSYYEGAQMIRNDKTMDAQAKQLALQNNTYDFQEKISGIRGAQAQAVSDFQKLAASGNYSQEQLASFATAMNIPNAMNPMYQADLRIKTAQAAMQEYEAKYQGQPPPEGTLERLQYDKLNLELKIAESEASKFSSNVPESELKSIFALPGKSRVTPGFGEGKKQCGEAYNDLTDGPKVGSSWASKINTVTKRDNPQVGNGIMLPLRAKQADGSYALTYGHVETVISVNAVTGDFKTVSYNRDGHGTQTIQDYNIGDLNAEHGNNWGFNDAKLKSKYLEKLENVSVQSGKDAGLYGKFEQIAKEQGMTDPADIKKFATEQVTSSYKDMTDVQAKTYDAYNKVHFDGQNYTNLTKGIVNDPVKMEEFANGINTITKAIKEDGLTAEVINRTGVSPEIQQAMMAEMRWIEGKLRKESGAAISKEEYQSNGLEYFPRAGDTAETIAKKAEARAQVEKGLKNQLGATAQRLLYEEDTASSAKIQEKQAANSAFWNTLLGGRADTTGQYTIPEDVAGDQTDNYIDNTF